jgi:hypothetical protein
MRLEIAGSVRLGKFRRRLRTKPGDLDGRFSRERRSNELVSGHTNDLTRNEPIEFLERLQIFRTEIYQSGHSGSFKSRGIKSGHTEPVPKPAAKPPDEEKGADTVTDTSASKLPPQGRCTGSSQKRGS